MSKKCCGIIYKDNEKFCTMCGKSLKDAEEVNSEIPSELPILNMEEVEKITAELLNDKKEDEKQDTQESTVDESVTAEPEAAPVEPESKSEVNSEVAEAKKEKNDENADDDNEDDEDDGQASPALKAFGTFMIVLLIASIVAVGLGVYFIMVNPFYRNHDINNPVIYDETATDTDINNIVERPSLAPVTIEDPTTEAVEEVATEQDAEAETQTETDAEEDEE